MFHKDSILNIAFHKKKKIVLTGGMEGNVCLSNYKSGKCMGLFEQHSESVESVLFMEQLQCFATGSLDKSIFIYNTDKMS